MCARAQLLPRHLLATSAPLADGHMQIRRMAVAFQSYNTLSPLVKFSHFIANQDTLEALDTTRTAST